ncbi:hypothetical protein Tco_1458931 [Tanacetum coccineum]
MSSRPKCSTFNGRPTFANPMYHKKAQYDPATRLIPDSEEILTLADKSRSKLNKDLVKPFDYTKLNSLYEIFKPPTQHYEIQFAQANEIRKKMWRKSFVKTKPNVFKNIDFLPVSKSVSKNLLYLRNPTAQDMEILVKTCLMPLALKTKNDSFAFVHELKQEMHADLKYVESLEDELDELESDKAEFSNMYDMLLQECSFAKLEKHSISLEIALQECQEQLKNDTVCKEKASNVFRKEREQYFEIQDLKAQLQDKNIAISELKKLIEKCKEKSVDTKFDKPFVVRQPNAQRIPKPSVLGKPTPFSNSPEVRSFQTKQSVNKTNVSDGSSNQVTLQNLPLNRKQAEIHSNERKPGMHRFATSTKQNREPQLPHASRNTNPYVSKSTGVTHPTSVSRPQLKSYQVKDKVVPNISQVKFTKKEVEDHHRISSISKKTKSVTKLNDVNARTKKPKVVPISASKLKRKANKSVATPHKKTVASDNTIQKPKSYFKELYENTNKAWRWWIAKKCSSEYKWTQTTPSRPSLKWKPTGRIFSNVRLSKQILGISAEVTSFNGQKQQRIDLTEDAHYNERQENLRVWLLKFLISKKPVPDRPYALSWKPCQGDSLNLPDHRIHKDGDGDASFQLESDSLPHAHAQTTKTYYKHQDSRIMKAQELKTKTSAQTLIYKIFLQRY